ncbi:uncharacterized protein IUM83_15340 [Phytophthora cinnamomi]|uniref:uncharacterized protein n=1 Tax=Phytophthora cinnamomi TaxID=4785 RepID=UPI003559BB76|nr:hypothetical protein IUM83_15340 [Phytophthora cinnamomi]
MLGFAPSFHATKPQHIGPHTHEKYFICNPSTRGSSPRFSVCKAGHAVATGARMSSRMCKQPSRFSDCNKGVPGTIVKSPADDIP